MYMFSAIVVIFKWIGALQLEIFLNSKCLGLVSVDVGVSPLDGKLKVTLEINPLIYRHRHYFNLAGRYELLNISWRLAQL